MTDGEALLGMDYGVGAGGGRCGSAALQWESIRKRGRASVETTQIVPVRGAAVQLFTGDRGERPLPVRHLPADAGTGAGVPSRFVRKIICRLRRNEVSRQWRRRSEPPPSASCSCTSCSPTGYLPLYDFLGHSLLPPFECLCGNFILPEPASYVSFFALFNLRNLLYIIRTKYPTKLA